jgi:hypothetical protein
MRLLVSSLIVIAATWNVADAFAEDAPATPPAIEKAAPPPPAAPAKFYLEVDQSDLNAIAQGINELPKRVADPLLLKLNGQLQAQEQLKAAADKSLTDAVEKAKKRK